MATSSTPIRLRLDPFCFRQFDDPTYAGTRFGDLSKDQFMAKLNEFVAAESPELGEGYAPFCKHIFVPNFTDATVGALEITPENEGLLKSGYKARRETELPVLKRWFPASAVTATKATFLDVILYSREQIEAESEAMGDAAPEGDYDWGVISVKGQDADHELPMDPITMMRNALGKDEGGSGVTLDAEKYRASVAYWESHAAIAAD